MKKESTIKFTSLTNRKCEVVITRTYGYENSIINADGHEWESKELLDYSVIIISIPEAKIINKSCSLHILCENERKILNTTANYSLAIDIDKKIALVLISDELFNKLLYLSKEKLNDDISSVDLNIINNVKRCILNNEVLPTKELNRKISEYNNINNESGDGYNPYISYISSEYVEAIKREYPNYF